MRLLSLLTLCLFYSCSPLPKESFGLFEWGPVVNYSEETATVEIHLKNPVHCPLMIDVVSKLDSANLSDQLSGVFPLLLPAAPKDSIIRLKGLAGEGKSVLSWSVKYTHTEDSIRTDSLFLPYPYGRTYTIMQGYNGSYSHNNAGARYALDFALPVGDTVCAAADGYVVGVIEGYKKGGGNKKWMNYANFINLYHPDKNVYTQYVHLRQNGSLVEVGDLVVAGQPIGISGQTGWTSKPHLHFNVVSMENNQRISRPCTFGQKKLTPGSEMRKGDRRQNLISRLRK